MDNLEKSDAGKHDIDSYLREIEEIIKYCNDIFKDISFTYTTVQYGFNDSFIFIREEKEKKCKNYLLTYNILIPIPSGFFYEKNSILYTY